MIIQNLGTRQVAELLQIKPATIQRAIWEGRLDPPAKGPGNAFFWNEADVQRAAWVLCKRSLKHILQEDCQEDPR